MQLTFLGHACWLCELSETRILFDPLLFEHHHGDVFELFPPRQLVAEELRPDFIVVSHAHPDHFDLPSLKRLAELDEGSVVLTSDELVADAARRLGFSDVACLAEFDRVTLPGGELLTTPSFGTDIEWGVMIADSAGVVFNQVDTVFRSVSDVRRVVDHALTALGRDRIDVALARFQPLLEIEAVTAGCLGFPFSAYAELLAEAQALGARAVLPASAGSRHADRHGAMNRLVYPLSQARFCRDLKARAPELDVLDTELGRRYRLHSGQVIVDAYAEALLRPLRDTGDDRFFAPLAIPELTDENPNGWPEAELLASGERFIEEALAPACEKNLSTQAPLRLALEVVGPTRRLGVTLVVEAEGVSVKNELDPDYDVLNQIAASSLSDVLAGRKHWGQPLLAGLLRSSFRAYRVDGSGLAPKPVAAFFLYYALPYAESVRRATEHLLAGLTTSDLSSEWRS